MQRVSEPGSAARLDEVSAEQVGYRLHSDFVFVAPSVMVSALRLGWLLGHSSVMGWAPNRQETGYR